MTVTPATNISMVFGDYPNGTTFCFVPGTYVLTTQVVPRTGDRLISATPRAAILTGLDQYNGGIFGYGGAAGTHDILVQGFVIQHFKEPWPDHPRAPLTPGDNWTIDNNEIAYNSQSGASLGNGTRLTNNWIHHNGRYGFTAGPLTGLLVENNDISFNNTAHNDPFNDAGGSKITKSSGIVLRGNNVHDNYGMGLWCDWENSGVTYENNTLANNYLAGIFHEASDQAVIRNNLFSGNGTYAIGKTIWFADDLQLNNSQNVDIYGNTIVAAANGIGLIDYERGSDKFGVVKIANVSIHDNNITLPAGGTSGLTTGRGGSYVPPNVHFTNNTYHLGNPGGAHWEWPNQATLSWSGWQGIGNDVGGSHS